LGRDLTSYVKPFVFKVLRGVWRLEAELRSGAVCSTNRKKTNPPSNRIRTLGGFSFFIAMTSHDKPRSSKQKYRLTNKGHQ